MNEKEFWIRVKDLLKKNNITQKDFSKDLGLPDRTIETWINRSTAIDVFTAYTIAKKLDVTVDFLVTGNEDERVKIVKDQITDILHKLEDQISSQLSSQQ